MFLRPRQPLFEGALCLMAGIVVADSFSEQREWFWIVTMLLVAGSALSASLRTAPARRWSLWLALTALACCGQWVRQANYPGRLLAGQIAPSGSVLHGVGVVDEDPVPGAPRFYVRLESAKLRGESYPSSARVAVTWPAELPPPVYGDRVEFTGTARNLHRPRNPGEFDAPAVRKRQGVWSEVRVRYPADARVVASDCGNRLIALSLKLRRWMERTMAQDLEDSPEAVSVIQSMVLGTQAEISGDVLDLFRYTGTIHLFSVSGIHTAMLAAMAFAAFQMAGLPRRAAALSVLPVLWLYCFVTGLTPSSLRATIMATVALGGIILDRPALSWNTLGASALAIVLVDPDQLFRPGFQLSFLMVAVLLAWAMPFQTWFGRFGQPDPFLPRSLWSPRLVSQAWAMRHLTAAFAVSFAAWLGSVPLTVAYFNLWSPSSVPANVVAIAFSWIILALGLGSALVGSVSTWFSVTLNNANLIFTKALMGALSLLASVPGSHLYVEKPALRKAPLCEVEILDLTGGGAIYIRTRAEGDQRRDWMIDCGGAGAFRWSVLPYLRSRGVNRLDGLIFTHGDSKHLGGAESLLESLPVAEVLDSAYRDRSSLRRRLHTLLAESATGKSILRRGDAVSLAPGIVLHVLYPPTGLKLRTADDKALVLRLDVETAGGTKRLLFTSDAGFTTERWLLENLPPGELRSDLFIKGMHVSDLSGTPEFLAAVQPLAVVTSSAEYPAAQRVKEEWASRLETAGIGLLRQEASGAVRIAIDRHGEWTAQGFVDDRTLRSSSR